MAAGTTSTILGTIQKYFEKAWMELPEEEIRTPLANADTLDNAIIPAHGGQYAEFRKFDLMEPETTAADDDTPKTYAENSEPSAPLVLNATPIHIPFELLRGFVDLGSVQMDTDPIDLMRKNKDALSMSVRRAMHQLCNSHFVQGISRTMSSAAIPPATTYLPAGFKTVFVGNGGYEGLTADSVFTFAFIKRGKMLLANAQVPRFKNGMYKCYLSEAVAAQLMEDPEFKDAVKRHRDLTGKALVDGVLTEWDGVQYILQDDPYRTLLKSQGGTFTKRRNAGAVHVAHMFGPHAAGYVGFGGAKSLRRTSLKPTFKVQDISVTGTNTTVGYTIPFQAAPLDLRRGLNLAGTTRHDESIVDLV